jgi:spermidine/putrescine transport system permease protein
MRFPKPPVADRPFSIGVPALIWQTLFFYLPLLLMIVSSFLQVSDTGKIQGVTLRSLSLFFSATYMKVIFSSLLLAISNGCICLLLAYPLAYFLAFRGKRFRDICLFLLLIPFWTNFLLHVYAWFYVLEKQGFLNNLLTTLGWIDSPILFLNSLFSIMVMMVYYYLPFMVLPIYSSLERFNPSLIEASYDLGASWWQTFRRILLPLSMRGVRAGFLLVYIPSFGEFAIPELMGGDKEMFVGNVVSQYILAEGTGSLGSAFTVISCLFLVLSAIGIYALMGRVIPETPGARK